MKRLVAAMAACLFAGPALAQQASPGDVVGGVYNSTVPTFASGQLVPLQFDVNGNLKTTGGGGGGGGGAITAPLGPSTSAAASVAVVYGSGATLPSGANTIGTVVQQDSLYVGGSTATTPVTGTAVGNLGTQFATAGYNSVSITLTGTFVGSVQYIESNVSTGNQVAVVGHGVIQAGTASDSALMTTAGTYTFPVSGAQGQLYISAYTSGTVNATATLRQSGFYTRSQAVTALAGSSIIGKIGIDQTTVGTTDSVTVKQNTAATATYVAEAGTASATAGIAPGVAGSASSGVVVKASSGNLYSAYATCTAACWLMVFNSATVPADGATTAGVASGNLQDCVPITSGGTGGVNNGPGPPEVFSVGISIAVSSTACATKTAATTGFIHGLVR